MSRTETQKAMRRSLPFVADPDESAWRAVARAWRPKTRADCVDGLRPCPFVGCRHHLAITVNEQNGSITYNHDVDDLESMPATCSLDVADDGIARDRSIVARYLGCTEDNVRWWEERLLTKIEPRMRKFRDATD